MVIGVRVPWPVDLERAGRLAGIRIAQVRRDAAILALELSDRVKRVRQAGDRRVQPAAGNQQQREAGAGLLIVDANRTFFVVRHGSSSFPWTRSHSLISLDVTRW